MKLFIDSRKRFERAVFHAEAIKTVWETLVDLKAYKTVIEPNSDWTEAVVRYQRTSPIPEHNLALQFGEMFYQLRSALDNLVYEASMILEKTNPPSNENSVEFPICSDPAKFSKNSVNRPPFPQKLRDWIESVQPYNVSKCATTEEKIRVYALRVLHDCARKDRHRRLHVVAAPLTEVGWSFFPIPGRILSITPLNMNLLEGDDEFLRLRLEGFDPKGSSEKIELNSDALFEISIDEIPLVIPGDSQRAMGAIFDSVNHVIVYFEDWFK